jgi:putative toxin-antitoxin system antitoxin component (TIGR02293 family)
MTADSTPASRRLGDRRRLGEILVDGGAITADQLRHALAEQGALGLPLGQTLLHLGFTTDETMRQALSSQLGVPYINLQHVIIDRSLAGLIDRAYAREHALFPVARIGNSLTIAMDDPTASAVVEGLAASTGYTITVVTSSADEIHRALVRLYERPGRTGEGAAAPAPPAPPPFGSGAHGYVALLGLLTVDLPDLVKAIENGLPYRAFEELVSHTGLPPERVAHVADIPETTLAGRARDGRFAPDESDRLVRTARVFGLALTLFGGDRSTTAAWLASAQPALGGGVPLDLARTDPGSREVETALSRLRRH